MRTNVVAKKPAVLTHEGAVAKRITPIQQLRRVTLACMLFEDQFYIDGKTSASQIDEAVAAVLKTKNGAKQVSDLAIETRTQGKLRHAPLYLAVSLIRHGKGTTKMAEECRAVVAQTLTGIIQRPDELAELLSLYWKDKKQPITKQMKLGLAAAFQKFDEYSLSKYANREGAISLRDVLFLVHARPKDKQQERLWKRLAAKELTAPDTWESNLSAGADKKETFTRLINEGKLGALALLRNLRNMQQSGVDEQIVRTAVKNMRTERVLPFRFLSAAKYAPQLEPELEAAMFSCLKSFEKLPGKTAICIDCSGSMGAAVSSKSEVSRKDAASALGMIIREICDGIVVIGFGTDALLATPRRGFALRDAVRSLHTGWGTDTGKAVRLAKLQGYDRIIVVTDEQSATPVENPGCSYNPEAKGYFINVAAYKNGIGYGKWHHIDGFSEATMQYIQQLEEQENQEG